MKQTVAFNPENFLEAAKAFLTGAASEAEFRTIVGRAYYAAYGSLRMRLCRAKGVDPDELFGKSGRHSKLIRSIENSSHDIRQVLFSYQRLWVERVHADYDYSAQMTHDDAKSAVSDAAWVIKQLANIQDRKFKSFPLATP